VENKGLAEDDFGQNPAKRGVSSEVRILKYLASNPPQKRKTPAKCWRQRLRGYF
jgi:hypothetical protein